MNREEPNLKALIAFEKTAASGNLTLAARQMNVSAGAVSRYIGILEDELGVELFERVNGRLQITKEGLEFYQGIHQGLDIIRRTARKVSSRDTSTIRIWCYPIFASEWLLPRVDRFQRREGIRVSLITGLEVPADVERQCELAIIPEENLAPDCNTRFLYKENLVPVCVPALMDGRSFDRQNIHTLPIVVAKARAEGWRDWLRLHFDYEWKMRVDFDQSSLALRAAREGIGFTLVADVWVSSSLKRGTLVMPFGERSVGGTHMFLAWEKRNRSLPAMTRLCDWLIDEMQECQTELEEVAEALRQT